MVPGDAAIGGLLDEFHTTRTDQERLFRFSISGRACEIVPASREHAACRGSECVVGSLVVDGNRYLVVTLAEPPAEAKPTTVERLTRRELEIAVLIAAGKVNKQIAYQLGISTWTVATYVRRIYCKLGVTNRAEMTAKLITAIMKQ